MLISNSYSSLFSLLTHSFTFFHSPPLLSLSFLPPLPSSSPLSIPHLSITSLAFLFLSISPFLLFYFSLYHLSCFPISLSITSLDFLFLSLSPLLLSFFLYLSVHNAFTQIYTKNQATLFFMKTPPPPSPLSSYSPGFLLMTSFNPGWLKTKHIPKHSWNMCTWNMIL